MSQFDPNFRIEDFNRINSLLEARKYILERLLHHPEALGNIVNEFLR